MPDRAADKLAKEIKTSPGIQWYRTALFRAGLLSAIGVFALLTFLVETTPSFPVDLQITRAIQAIDSPVFAALMSFISWPGFLPQSVLIILLIAFTLYMYGFRWESVLSLLTALVSGVTNQSIKYMIQRPRPASDVVDVFETLASYSFPSGHVMFYVTFFGFVWYVIYTVLKRSAQRSLLLTFFGTLIVLVGISRIYLGQHWASDVLGAYLLGSLILVGIIVFHQWGKTRFFPLNGSEKE
jgi:membrane-associated phospholipid phosphatase